MLVELSCVGGVISVDGVELLFRKESGSSNRHRILHTKSSKCQMAEQLPIISINDIIGKEAPFETEKAAFKRSLAKKRKW